MRNLVSRIRRKKLSLYATLAVFVLLVLVLPLTVFLAKQQQQTRQYAAGSGTDYYVATTGSDSNPGTQTAPWRTITHAASVVTAGATVHVTAGTYTEGEITVSASGTSSAPITFISDTPLAAKIADSSWHAWNITGSYITIQNFEMYMTNPNSASDIVDMSGANYVSVIGNYVHDWDNGSGAPCYGGSAINSHPATGLRIIGNRIAHGGPTSTSCNQMHGVYVAGDNIVIANNIAWDISGYCYQAWPTLTNSQVMNNDGDNCRSGGIIMGWDGLTQPQTNNDVVGNNIMRTITGNGIRDCCSGTPPGTNMRYLNNDVYNTTDTPYFFYQSASVNTGGKSVDPTYVNWISSGGGDYHLQSTSPMVDAGTSTDAPATDFDGNSRPQGAGFDIGAYEYLSGTTPAPTATPTPTGTSSCLASTASWQNQPIASQTGTFEATFDVTPNMSTADGVIGLSQNAAAAYTDLAAIVSVDPNGSFTAMNGSVYQADNTVSYIGGNTYHFRLDIAIPTHTYSIYVTPPGSSEITLGANYAFRTEQNTVTNLNYLAAITTTGSVNVCNITTKPLATPTNTPTPTLSNTPTPTFTPAPTSTPIPTPTSTPKPTPTNTPVPTSTPTPIPPDTTPPTITITSPANGATVKHGSTITITATDSDNVGVTQVQFLVNGTLLCSNLNPSSSTSCNWPVPGKRGVTYTLTARAYDAMGNAASNSIQVKSSQ